MDRKMKERFAALNFKSSFGVLDTSTGGFSVGGRVGIVIAALVASLVVVVLAVLLLVY
jgi:uncharacterized membrane protein